MRSRDAPPDHLGSGLERRIDLEVRQTLAGVRAPELDGRVLAGAALSRAHTTWSELLVMTVESRQELAGVAIRLLWEYWVTGLYLVLADRDALLEVYGEYERTRRLIGTGPTGGGEPGSRRGRRWNLAQVAERVDHLRYGEEPRLEPAVVLYNAIYRGESTWRAHATWVPLIRRVRRLQDGVDVSFEDTAPPLHDDDVRVGSLLVLHLAWYVAHAFGLRSENLSGLVEILHAIGPDDDE